MLNRLDRFPEHLHRLDLLVLLECWYLNRVTNGCRSCKDCTRDDSPLTLDLEAVVDCKEEIFLSATTSVWNLDLLKDSSNHIIYAFSLKASSLICADGCGHRHDFGGGAEL